MLHLSLTAAAALLAAHAASACTEKMQDRALAESVDQMLDLGPEAGQPHADKVRAAVDAGNGDYCAAYSLARFLTQAEDYDTARHYIAEALESPTEVDLQQTAPWNVIGYTFLQERDMQNALRAFRHQLTHTSFDALPQNTQMKVFNNTGYTAMQVGQYDVAIDALAKSADLGSRTGARNLEIAESIVSTLKSGDIDAPGVFTTVLRSLKHKENVEPALKEAADLLGSDEELSVFLSQNDYYAIAFGAYESFPKSEIRQRLARSNGFPDAYSTSVAEWKDVTVEFMGKR